MYLSSEPDRHIILANEISKWLSGTHNFSSDALFDIEEILGIEVITTENIFTQRNPTNT